MNTSAGTIKYFYKYGRLDFMIEGKEFLLYVYQGKDLMQSMKNIKTIYLCPLPMPQQATKVMAAAGILNFIKEI